jgi:energy-coupling factor transport system permease protein
MNTKMKFFSYNTADTPIHRLSGSNQADLLPVPYLRGDVFVRYPRSPECDGFSIILMRIALIRFSQIRVMVIYVLFFLVTNAVISFFFAPEYGVSIYGTRHEFAQVFGISLTYEQMFYQVTKFFKYAAVVPLGMIFLLTTNPSEFASSLNGIGVNYKAAFAVALTLRYFPDIQRDYRDIYLSQQARGWNCRIRPGSPTALKIPC